MALLPLFGSSVCHADQFLTLKNLILSSLNLFIDTWKGSKFMKTVISWDSVLVDWISFFVFFGFPIIVASITLAMKSAQWWTITSLSWFILVVAYFVVFTISAIYYEVDGYVHKDLFEYSPYATIF